MGYNYQDQPITAGDLKAQGALAALLVEALNQLSSNFRAYSAFIHGGPAKQFMVVIVLWLPESP